jgi:hypothetical protein
MYFMLRGLIMDGNNSLNLTSLSLLYRVVYFLYSWTLFLLLNTFWHELSRLETLSNELLYIISFGLYNVSVILFDAI